MRATMRCWHLFFVFRCWLGCPTQQSPLLCVLLLQVFARELVVVHCMVSVLRDASSEHGLALEGVVMEGMTFLTSPRSKFYDPSGGSKRCALLAVAMGLEAELSRECPEHASLVTCHGWLVVHVRVFPS
jgi:hypothetical protein